MANRLTHLQNRPGPYTAGSFLLWAVLLLSVGLTGCSNTQEAHLRIGTDHCILPESGYQISETSSVHRQVFNAHIALDSAGHFLHKVLSNGTTEMYTSILTRHTVRSAFELAIGQYEKVAGKHLSSDGTAGSYLLYRDGYWRQGLIMVQKNSSDLVLIDHLWPEESDADRPHADTIDYSRIIAPC